MRERMGIGFQTDPLPTTASGPPQSRARLAKTTGSGHSFWFVGVKRCACGVFEFRNSRPPRLQADFAAALTTAFAGAKAFADGVPDLRQVSGWPPPAGNLRVQAGEFRDRLILLGKGSFNGWRAIPARSPAKGGGLRLPIRKRWRVRVSGGGWKAVGMAMATVP